MLKLKVLLFGVSSKTSISQKSLGLFLLIILIVPVKFLFSTFGATTSTSTLNKPSSGVKFSPE